MSTRQLPYQPLGSIQAHDGTLEEPTVDLAVEEQHGVASLARTEPVRKSTDDLVHRLQHVGDGVPTDDGVNEDRTVELDILIQDARESRRPRVGAADGFEWMHPA